MSIFDITSYNSLRRGFDYYESKRVSKLTKKNDSDYEAIVSNSEHHEYHVCFNTKHLRKSTCDCPHADGRMIICKHKVAVFFQIFPHEAEIFKEEIDAQEKEAELLYQTHLRKQRERYEEVKAYVEQLPLETLKQTLIDYMMDQYDEEDDFTELY
ncbi:MAG: SWIM zinc finger family protein [Acholeplasmataceae bacterium]